MAKNNDNKKPSGLKRFFGRIARFFGDIVAELKKVVWMNKKELAASTFTVLIACFLFGAIIWLVDAGMAEIYKYLFN